MPEEPSELDVLRIFVEAHNQRHPNTGDREPIMFAQYLGGSSLQHHGMQAAPEGVDEAFLEEMRLKGLISIEYHDHTWDITPTAFGREVVDQSDRINREDPSADLSPLADALGSQAQAQNPLAWPAVRPVLASFRDYWAASGYPQHGIALRPIGGAVPEGHDGLFSATVRALVRGGYLEGGSLSLVMKDEGGVVSELPGEVALTDKAHAVLDGWPGAGPEELFENLLAVITASAEREADPSRKRRLEALGATIRETGVAITSEVIAKVLLGGVH